MILMKKFISLALITTVLLTMLSGCGEKKPTGEDTETTVSTTAESTEKKETEQKEKYDFIDNTNGLLMKMGDEYFNFSDSLNKVFYDDDVVIAYTTFYDDTDGSIKDVMLFEEFFAGLISSQVLFYRGKADFKEGETKTINGFKVRSFEGTMTDDDGVVHSAKAYTFVCEPKDCLVIAVTKVENEENAQKMKNEIDVFMNNLAIYE